jgi:hypothetical protein
VVLNLLKGGINPKAIFHDLYIQKPNGEYTQVDVAVATKAGIIVFEVKDYSGWIFGNEHQRHWTQLLAYGKEKHRFYNPVMQNSGHIQAIRQCLPQNPGIPIYSVIVFFGNSEFKNVTCNANNTFIIYPRSIRQVVAEILMQPNANYGNKYEIMDVFAKAVQNGNDPMIASSQINSAAYYGRNTPQSTYTISLIHYSALAGSRTEEDFGSPFIIKFLHLYSVILFSLNLPIIFTLCHIAHLIECVAMFDFIKRLPVFRIAAQPCTHCLLLFGSFPVLLHYTLDVGSFGRGED